MAPHSSTLAWKIPWTEEAGRLQSMGLWRAGHERLHFHALEKQVATYSSVLAWRIPGMGEPGGLSSMGSHRVGPDWSDLAVASAVHFDYLKCATSWEYKVGYIRSPHRQGSHINIQKHIAIYWLPGNVRYTYLTALSKIYARIPVL